MCIRDSIIYLCVLFAMRLMGKRQLGELQPEELVSTILISNLASISIESEEVPITSSLIPLFLIAALELLGSVLSFRSQKSVSYTHLDVYKRQSPHRSDPVPSAYRQLPC